MTGEAKRLRKGRRTLHSLKRYCSLQAHCAKKGIITPGRDWRQTYEKVNKMIAEWAAKALKESRMKAGRRKGQKRLT